MPKESDKRRLPRFSVEDCHVTFTHGDLRKFLESDPHHCPLTNLSRGGIQFLSKVPLESDRDLKLAIDIPAFDKPMQIMARLKWQVRVGKDNIYRVGMEFIDPEKNLDKLLRILETTGALCDMRRDQEAL